jgi:hypothetical protein
MICSCVYFGGEKVSRYIAYMSGDMGWGGLDGGQGCLGSICIAFALYLKVGRIARFTTHVMFKKLIETFKARVSWLCEEFRSSSLVFSKLGYKHR